MAVKSMPMKVDGATVVKAMFLGWLSAHSATSGKPFYPGYFCFALTHGGAGASGGSELTAHLMLAAGIDKPWRKAQSWEAIDPSEAAKLFTQHEKLAVWPGQGDA